jgi:hypothetical protein
MDATRGGLRDWPATELTMLAGGLLACGAAVAALAAGLPAARALNVGPAGAATALLAWRIHRLDARSRLVALYAGATLLFGLTTAGDGYLRLAIGGSTQPGAAWAWTAVAAGVVTLGGAGGRLLVGRR